MKNMLIEVLICFSLILIELIIVVSDYYLRKIDLNKKIKNIELTEELSQIVLDYYECFNKKELMGMPYIREYILQAQDIILKKPYDLFEIEVTTLRDLEKNDKKPGQAVHFDQMLDELINSPRNVQKLFFRVNKVLENVIGRAHV